MKITNLKTELKKTGRSLEQQTIEIHFVHTIKGVQGILKPYQLRGSKVRYLTILNLKKYESKADIFSTSQLKGKYIVPIVKYCSGSKEHFQHPPEILFH